LEPTSILKASNTNAHDNFGWPVSLSGNTLAVGAPNEQSCATGINRNQLDNGCGGFVLDGSGAAYIFTRSGSVWTQEAYVKASNTRTGHAFGIDVSLDGDTLAVGAAGEVTHVDRETYLELMLPSRAIPLVVGAPGEASCASGTNGNELDNGCGLSGAVYMFGRTNNRWSQVAYVKPIASSVTTSVAREFGRWRRYGTTLAVGAPDDSCGTGFNPSAGLNDCYASGAVYLFYEDRDQVGAVGLCEGLQYRGRNFGASGLAINGIPWQWVRRRSKAALQGSTAIRRITVVA
jgi:hypothetical protein